MTTMPPRRPGALAVTLAASLMLFAAACASQGSSLSGASARQVAPTTAAIAYPGADSAESVAAPAVTAESQAVNPWGAMAQPAGESAAGAAADSSAGDGPVTRAGSQPATLPPTANPAACQQFLKPLVDVAKTAGNVELAVTTMPADGRYVGHATGMVKSVSKPTAAGQPPKYALEGDMWQFFSDRVVPDDTVIKYKGAVPSIPPPHQRFDKDNADLISVSVDASTGNTSLILKTWGNALVTLHPTCEQGMMYGFNDGQLYMMTIKDAREVKRQ